MLNRRGKLAGASIVRVRTVAGNQISATDRQIDALDYEPYGQTDEEICIVEEAKAR
ncbi:MAG: hypothetical protein ACRDTR_19685 [Rubrobacter sp.]